MNLKKLFEIFEIEENRRFNDNLEDEEILFWEKEKNKYKEGYGIFLKNYEKYEHGKTTSSKENFDAISDFGLSLEEGAIIFMYTAHGIHQDVNSQLRTNPQNLDSDIKEYIRFLNLALDKMPSFNKNIVFREIFNPDNIDEVLNYYEARIGIVHVEKAFMSTHIKDERWSCKENEIQIKIATSANSKGKDLRKLSFNVDESEVLFKPSSQFTIMKVCKKNNLIEMKEVGE